MLSSFLAMAGEPSIGGRLGSRSSATSFQLDTSIASCPDQNQSVGSHCQAIGIQQSLSPITHAIPNTKYIFDGSPFVNGHKFSGSTSSSGQLHAGSATSFLGGGNDGNTRRSSNGIRLTDSDPSTPSGDSEFNHSGRNSDNTSASSSSRSTNRNSTAFNEEQKPAEEKTEEPAGEKAEEAGKKPAEEQAPEKESDPVGEGGRKMMIFNY
jgi:hypothetical protein